VQSAMDDAMSALSSGKRITSAADDAAGLSIVTRMESQVRGLNQAMRNAADGQSMVDTAEGAMDEISNMLQRMRELALQAANGSNNLEDRNNLNAEVSQLKAEIDRVVDTTSFNNQTMLDGSYEKALQVGTNAGETIEVNISNLGTAALGSVSGSAAIGSVRSAEFTSVSEHKDTVAQLTFNGNDTYDFELYFGDTKVTVKDANVVDGSAEEVVDQINKQLTTAKLNDVAEATYAGNVVTITNDLGTDVKVAAFAADANSTASYVSLSGKASGSLETGEKLDNVTLGGANSHIGDSFQVAKGEAYSTGEAVDAVAEVQTLAVKDVTFTVDKTVKVTLGDGDAAVTLEHKVVTDKTSVDDVLEGLQAHGSYDDTKFVLAKNDDGNITVTFAEATGAVTALSKLVDDADTPLNVEATETTEGVTAVDATDPSGGAVLNLDFVGADTYEFELVEADKEAKSIESFKVVYDGSDNGLEAVATVIGTKLGDGWTVAAKNGQVEVIREAGTAYTLTGFKSEGGGRIMASTENPSETDGAAKLLEENNNVQTALTTGVGDATDTVVKLTVSSAKDNYSFTLSNGEATAHVSAALDNSEDLASAINYALARAGMGGADTTTGIKAVATEGKATEVTLTNLAGKPINIDDFMSDGAGTMKAEKGLDKDSKAVADGYDRILDDGDGSNADAVSSIDLSSVSGASAALAVIDAALEDISAQRADLGAISNRLDHTISNLGNIVVNTEAAQSRIEDADFAAETGNLTKAQILSQAATAMLAQANASKQSVLSLLQG